MIILTNARVHTLDPLHPEASALILDGDRFLAVGETQELLAGSDSRPLRLEDSFSFQEQAQDPRRVTVVDMQGCTLLPGLTDAHIHLDYFSMSLQKVDCETPTKEECLRRVSERARLYSSARWVLGHGWNQNHWQGGFGSADELEAAAPQNPVYLTAKSLHAGWANRSALRLAGVTAATTDPLGGRIGRDPSGEPDGILYESAMNLVAAVVPELTQDEFVETLLAAQVALWRVGLTGVHDFDGARCFNALQRLHSQGELRLRVLKSLPLNSLEHVRALGLRSGFGDDFLRIGSLKGFADGALGPRTAAMLQPYESEPENRGMLLLDGEEIFERGRAAVESGLSLAIHAIGDLANHEVLDGLAQLRLYEKALKVPGSGLAPPLRHRIEHVQLIHPDDAGRLAELGIVASMQPVHATSDMGMAERFWGERAAFSYAWRTQLAHRATLAFGSDAPVESPNPFWGLHAAVTRRAADGSPGVDGWYPEQCLSLHEALLGFTQGPAYTAGMEYRLGKLAPGYLADLLVLERDPFAVEPEALRDLLPAAVMVGGRWVYKK
jgi:hypothetical protein